MALFCYHSTLTRSISNAMAFPIRTRTVYYRSDSEFLHTISENHFTPIIRSINSFALLNCWSEWAWRKNSEILTGVYWYFWNFAYQMPDSDMKFASAIRRNCLGNTSGCSRTPFRSLPIEPFEWYASGGCVCAASASYINTIAPNNANGTESFIYQFDFPSIQQELYSFSSSEFVSNWKFPNKLMFANAEFLQRR